MSETISGIEFESMCNSHDRDGIGIVDLDALGIGKVLIEQTVEIKRMVSIRGYGCTFTPVESLPWMIRFDPLVPRDRLLRMVRRDAFIHGITLDCQWRSRGVRLVNIDRSAFRDFTVLRPKGYGILCDDVRETTFDGCNIALGIENSGESLFELQEQGAATDGTNNIRVNNCEFIGSSTKTYVRVKTYDKTVRIITFNDCLFHKPWDKLNSVARAAGCPQEMSDRDPSQILLELDRAKGVVVAGSRFRLPDHKEAFGVVSRNSELTLRDNIVHATEPARFSRHEHFGTILQGQAR